MANPIKHLTPQELLKTLERLIKENPQHETILKLMLSEGTDNTELISAIVNEVTRRENKQFLPQNYIHNKLFNHKIDQYNPPTPTLPSQQQQESTQPTRDFIQKSPYTIDKDIESDSTTTGNKKPWELL